MYGPRFVAVVEDEAGREPMQRIIMLGEAALRRLGDEERRRRVGGRLVSCGVWRAVVWRMEMKGRFEACVRADILVVVRLVLREVFIFVKDEIETLVVSTGCRLSVVT
jgi:hypothetical protein